MPSTGVVVGVPCRGYTYHNAFQTLRDSMPLSLARLPKTKQNKTCSTLFLVVDGERLTGVSTIMRTGGITASVFFFSIPLGHSEISGIVCSFTAHNDIRKWGANNQPAHSFHSTEQAVQQRVAICVAAAADPS